ncbi:hypothetical protein E2C01_024073 [Portunus trituberculatus]|uniref:Uncharacterized protein n=1 Tax=Portunus trituberculatus TaxID=210409 RepID=A0A5B7ECW0_PORTR|nr:hypothetical protein [Portunus trituberculatus]
MGAAGSSLSGIEREGSGEPVGVVQRRRLNIGGSGYCSPGAAVQGEPPPPPRTHLRDACSRRHRRRTHQLQTQCLLVNVTCERWVAHDSTGTGKNGKEHQASEAKEEADRRYYVNHQYQQRQTLLPPTRTPSPPRGYEITISSKQRHYSNNNSADSRSGRVSLTPAHPASGGRRRMARIGTSQACVPDRGGPH